MAKIGSVIEGKYEILKEVGRGGMSVVYLAMDNRLNKQWAIKEIKKKGTNSENQIVMQSLLSEANLMKRLDHPNLPRIVDIIDNGKTIYIVMDYIEGEPLDKILKKKGAQPQEAVIEWGRQLAEALDYLHTRKPPIIYRDMKPANVMLKPDGSIKLYDFGIAREYKEQNSSDTVSLGTKGYAAPEQFGGMGQTDARTDVYGWGVTMYHLVTGKNPCEPPYEILPIRDVNPNLSSGLEAVIQKCTQLNPDERFQSIAEVLYALDHLDKIDESYRKKQKTKLNSFIISAAFSVVMLLAGIGTFIGYKATLSQSVAEAIEAYGSASAGGGDVAQLKETIEDYGSEVSDDVLKELLDNYVDVCENELIAIESEYNQALTTAGGVLAPESKKEFEDRETKVFDDLNSVIKDYAKELGAADMSAVYYDVGYVYMNHYQYCKGSLDNTYINIRYEEAAHRFKNVTEGLNADTIKFPQQVSVVGDVISKFKKTQQNSLSGIDMSLTDEELKQTWTDMSQSIVELEKDDEKVNLYLIIGNILYAQKADYKNVADITEEIKVFCADAVTYLQSYSAAHPENEYNMKSKSDKAIEYYQKVHQHLSVESAEE